MKCEYDFFFLQVADSSSLKRVLRCHTNTRTVGLYKQTLSFHYQPATFPAIYFEFLAGTHHEKQICAHLHGSWACRAPAPRICQGMGNCRRNSAWLSDSVLKGHRTGLVGELMEPERGAHTPSVEIALTISEHSV